MARKFDEIDIDGGKRVRNVTVKIEHPSGVFEAVLDDCKHTAPSLEELRRVLTEAAMAADALTFETYYQLNDRYDGVALRALSISNETVEVENRRSYRYRGKAPSRRYVVLTLSEDFTVDADATRGDLRDFQPPDDQRFIPVTAETAKAVTALMSRLRAFEDEEKAIAQRRGAVLSCLEESFSHYGTGPPSLSEMEFLSAVAKALEAKPEEP